MNHLSSGSYEIVKCGNLVIVSFNSSVVSSGIGINASIVISDNMPKPVAFTSSCIKISKESSSYAFETIACAIGTDGVMTLINSNIVAGMGSGNRIHGQLVYLTNE